MARLIQSGGGELPSRRTMGGGGQTSYSSSGEEDGDAEWRAAINSATSTATVFRNASDGLPLSFIGGAIHEDENEKHKPQKLKHYQIKARKLLVDMLDESIEFVTEKAPVLEAAEDAGVRLFRKAPPGIVFDRREELHGPKKKPKIVPANELHEKSKKFKKRVECVVVEGADVISAARREREKSLAKVEARERAAKEAAKREEERVAGLKKIRGERWLPCIAREMRLTAQCRR